MYIEQNKINYSCTRELNEVCCYYYFIRMNRARSLERFNDLYPIEVLIYNVKFTFHRSSWHLLKSVCLWTLIRNNHPLMI